MDIKNKIKNIIKQVVCSLSDKDSSIYPKNQVFANDKTSQVNRWSIYGYCYNPPEQTLGLAFCSQGKESTKFVLFNNPTDRKKELEPGEIAIYHAQSGNYLYLKNDGGIEIKSNSDITLNAENNINLVSDNLTHNGVNIGDTHVHDAGTQILINLKDTTGGLCTGKTAEPE